MRMTSTTSSPVIAKEITAAGPAALMTTPLPTNSPAPMTPPRAIIVMCLCFRLWRSPLVPGGVSFILVILTVAPLYRKRPRRIQPFHPRGQTQERSGKGQNHERHVDDKVRGPAVKRLLKEIRNEDQADVFDAENA